MANYAGETLVVGHVVELEGETLTDDDVGDVEITIFDADGEEVVETTVMVYDSAAGRWEYVWDTSPGATPVPIDPGTYRAFVLVNGAGGSQNWEWKRIRLARNPFDPPSL